ncbi:hypothetical protein V8C42DRAFT_322087 [Trichoderma barbatum]
MDLPINYSLTTPLHSITMTALPSGTIDAHKETILVASCLGGGMLLVTAIVTTIMVVKRRARLTKINERNLKMEAMEAWARGV